MTNAAARAARTCRHSRAATVCLAVRGQPAGHHGHVVRTAGPTPGLALNDAVARTIIRPGTSYFWERP
ncbi:MAG: hypothetical protein KC442_09465 [Thermomicrobiales bacterium]|nr:hypothetical protein [Thermomicrobiales bacterium]